MWTGLRSIRSRPCDQGVLDFTGQAKISDRVRYLSADTRACRWRTAVSREPGRPERQLNMNKDIGAVAGYGGAADSDVQLAAAQEPGSAAEGLTPPTDGADEAENRSDRDGPDGVDK